MSVGPGVKTPGNDNADQYDVLHMETTKGKVLKIVASRSNHSAQQFVSEKIQIFQYLAVVVKNLQVNYDKLMLSLIMR